MPTTETRAKVNALASFGITQAQICKYIGISEMTLRKHYRNELDVAKIDKVVAVANALYKNAVDKGNVTAQIFFLKTQGCWREVDSQINDEEDTQIGKIEIEVIKGKNNG